MRLILWAIALGIFLISALPSKPTAGWTLVIGGSLEGYLTPCGCTKPMSGGIKRRASAVKELSKSGRITVLELGPLTGGLGRQQEMKAETAAETLKGMNVAAISLAAEDASHGSGVVAAIQRLSGGKLIASGISGGLEGELPPMVEDGPFLIGSWDGRSGQMASSLGGEKIAESEAITSLISEAKNLGKSAVLLFEGGLTAAQAMARSHPDLSLIIYRSSSQPPRELLRIGRTTLMTPGPKGKAVVTLSFREGKFENLQVADLDPSVKDDPEAARMFQTYQGRVAGEKLLDMLPRRPEKGFVGSKACISCHSKAGDVWMASGHAKALKTLELEKSDRDPDCVSCHVVGLDAEKGFKSRSETPDLADVGCESCHGPGEDHSMQPFVHKMPKVGEKSCASCHVADHSPGFDFKTYWPKIAH